MPIFYGWRTFRQTQKQLAKGEVPETSDGSEVILNMDQIYVHVFFIPVTPIPKSVKTFIKRPGDSEYQELKQKSPELKEKMKQFKTEVKTPVWTYIAGLLLIALLTWVIGMTIFANMSTKTDTIADIQVLDKKDYVLLDTKRAGLSDEISYEWLALKPVEFKENSIIFAPSEMVYDSVYALVDELEAPNPEATVKFLENEEELLEIEKSQLSTWTEETIIFDVVNR